MQAQNLEEYKEIRKELADLKNCITTYTGFALGGTATAVWGLAAKASDKNLNLTMAFAALLFAVLATLVLFVLSYKFTSHNRYVGYSKLLTHERFEPKPSLASSLFAWEICLDRLRAVECCKGFTFSDYCERLRYVIEGFEKLDEIMKGRFPSLWPNDKTEGRGPTANPSGRNSAENNTASQKREARPIANGWTLLRRSSREESGSWKFPLYVARIFAAVNIIFVFFAGYFVFVACKANDFRLRPTSLFVTSVLAAVFLLGCLWKKFLSKLFEQMCGSETVEAFCWKFLPIRAYFLQELSDQEDIKYKLVGVNPVIQSAKTMTV